MGVCSSLLYAFIEKFALEGVLFRTGRKWGGRTRLDGVTFEKGIVSIFAARGIWDEVLLACIEIVLYFILGYFMSFCYFV